MVQNKFFVQKVLPTAKKCDIIYKYEQYRGVAQLVARVVWDHEVAGSIPVTSTIFLQFLQKVERIYKNSKTFKYAIF